ncbi:cell division protein SepF [Enterococcus dongliensis]|uniref:Cell division protein SepF n=1 Tax=Enterococcus dongliensis TaxID=2559925 RepID=A0AAP5KR23_9ENTE|nr:cell division protein SepF [Enterococcus dongliensis]MDT2596834.1 cell division protein SepF [Enterococcus dongliensis]MDT2633492.1 cell division protein SepF [Enterococcus dongliensis]MDT2636134.1 cell division protein SepF [Enterococcus dongliensis]MDT2638960.1 cell division protein SepF [Enterococcus dongliensis]MDT2641286.1 cell division protein SepF [Enterococcus dongliensis]
MGISLAKITDFFGLADDDMYEAATPAPKKQVSRPQKSVPKKERVLKERSTYQKQERPVKERVQPVAEPTVNRRAESVVKKAESAPKINEKIVSMPNNSSRTQRLAPKMEEKRKDRISVVEPRAYNEAMTIAKRVGQGEVVLINFQSLDEMKARRVVDFLTGVVFMIDGDIKRVGNEMFLCTPTNVEITNSALSSMVDDDIYGLEM